MATAMHQGRVAIVTAGTAVALASAQEVNWLIISAPRSNLGVIFLGASTVTGEGVTTAATDGYMLMPGREVKLDACDLADVYIEGKAVDCVYYAAGSGT